MKRKNCCDAVGRCNRKTRLAGVDPNRNYGGLWGGSGASPNPLSDTYRGPGPFSEPEMKNVRELVATRQVVTLITNHTYSNLVLRVPGTIDQGFPLEEPQYKALGARMTAHNNYANLPGFGLYDTTGSTEDWTFWSAGGARASRSRSGRTEFHPPYEDRRRRGVPRPAAGSGGRQGRQPRGVLRDALGNRRDGAAFGPDGVGAGRLDARGSRSRLRRRHRRSARKRLHGGLGAKQFFQDKLESSMTTPAAADDFACARQPARRVRGRRYASRTPWPRRGRRLAWHACEPGDGFPAENGQLRPFPTTGPRRRSRSRSRARRTAWTTGA